MLAGQFLIAHARARSSERAELRSDPTRIIHRDGCEEGVNDLRVELPGGLAGDLRQRVWNRSARLVRPVVGHRVEGVGDGHDSTGERDQLTGQPMRIAAAVPALVMGLDDLRFFAQFRELAE